MEDALGIIVKMKQRIYEKKKKKSVLFLVSRKKNKNKSITKYEESSDSKPNLPNQQNSVSNSLKLLPVLAI